MTRQEILDLAKKCVCGEREADYGKPEDNFRTIAELWEVYLDSAHPNIQHNISAKDVAVMMALLKIARIATGKSPDSFVDLAGYAACAGEIVDGDQTIDLKNVTDTVSDYLHTNYDLTGNKADRVKRSEFNEDYEKWCHENGKTPLSRNNIQKRALKNGLHVRKHNGIYEYVGLKRKYPEFTNNSNFCVSCGVEIPEGRQICYQCEECEQ